jgi:hypothetical protein
LIPFKVKRERTFIFPRRPRREERRFFPRMENSGRPRKPIPSSQSKCQEGGDLQEPWMNKRKTGTLGYRRLFGDFSGGKKVTRRRNRGPPKSPFISGFHFYALFFFTFFIKFPIPDLTEHSSIVADLSRMIADLSSVVADRSWVIEDLSSIVPDRS